MTTSYLDPGTGSIVLQLLVMALLLLGLPVLIIVLVVRASKKPRPNMPGAVAQMPPPPSGQWYADPTGRFAQRWWSEGRWTDRVVLDSGQTTMDPSPLPDPPPDAPAGAST